MLIPSVHANDIEIINDDDDVEHNKINLVNHYRLLI